MISQVIEVLKGIVPAIGVALALYGGVWIKRIFDQKKRNAVNEIDLSFKKIDLDTHSQPLTDTVAESNKSHGAGVVKGPGDDTKSG
jgi:hypothetical protein